MKKVLLIIRDGRGYRESDVDNAIAQADTPYTDRLMEKYPHVLLDASWEAVWLPDWYEGNSEVWHMTLWSGKILFQSLTRINKSILDGTFFKIPEFIEAINHCKKNNTHLHLMWLLQTEWVHAHIDHLFALLDLCRRHEFKNVLIHVFTDGRDAPVMKSKELILQLQNKLDEIWFWKIVSIIWRYFSMDRDRKWDRIEKAYSVIMEALDSDSKRIFIDPLEFIRDVHQEGETDEFIRARSLKWYNGVCDGDAMIFWNFRTDRTRQLTQAIVEDNFKWFERKKKNIYFVGMNQYYDDMNAEVAFDKEILKNTLGSVVSKSWYRQLRISETEKYAHVTHFFNGQEEAPYENEDRILIDSPKVSTYDESPEMSAYAIKDRLINEIEGEKYHFIVCNLVNADMVWHTWLIEPIIKAIETVDTCVGQIVEIANKYDYITLITADHWNVEDQTDEWRTSHTLNPVPLIVASDWNDVDLKNCKWLSDVAGLVLDFMNIKD